jgi:hypothetical protein
MPSVSPPAPWLLGPERLLIYNSHHRKQPQLINNPSTPACRRDLA